MKRLRIGVAGLGRAFSLMAPAFRDPRVELVAAADPRAEALERFRQEYGGRTFRSVEEMCADAALEVVYVATPHELHAAHARAAAQHGKHVLVEKPMALSLDECRGMIDAARAAGVHLIVGHSHSYDAPIARTRELIRGRTFGRLAMISALNYTDWLYRPRRPEELGTAILNQASHQVDIVRLLAGGRVTSVRAHTGSWDAARPAHAAYSCQLAFDNGVFATLVYSGYAHFDSDELMGWIGELGQEKDPAKYGEARSRLAGDELALKNARNYGGAAFSAPEALAHQHFGVVIASCEKADLRPLPTGVMIYGDSERRLDALPAPKYPRAEVIDELYAAVVDGKPPLHSGEWAMATLEVVLSIVSRSSRPSP